MFQISRRSFIKMTSLLPVALFLKPSDALACPLCFLVVDVLLGWAERGVAMEALEVVAANSARSAIIGGVERSIIRSAFSNTAKQRILSGLKILDKTEESASVLSRLDAIAQNRPDLVASYDQYENDIQAWWFIQNENNIMIEIINPKSSVVNTMLVIRSKNKGAEDSQILFKGGIKISADEKTKYNFKVPNGILEKDGVKDIVIELEETGISPIIKTVFVV